jgi:hypothetical protein
VKSELHAVRLGAAAKINVVATRAQGSVPLVPHIH